MMLIRTRFFSEVGVAVVLLTALVSVAVSAISITSYLDHANSWCGTVTMQIRDFVGLWFVLALLASIIGVALAGWHKLCPRVCRMGWVITFISWLAALLVVGNS
jgi:hypothetical protein